MSEPQSATRLDRQKYAQQHAAPHASAVLTIDLGALRRNYRKLKAAAPGAECAAVVKADAYGTGAMQSAKALAQEGCDTFFVTTLEEAHGVRQAVPDAAIYVLDGFFRGTSPNFAAASVRPVLGSLPEIEEWAQFGAAQSESVRAALHIDTGMNRHGLTEGEIETIAANPGLLKGLEISLVLSHLACADDLAHAKNTEQRQAFEQLHAKLPDAPHSLANSGGIFLGPDYHYDMVRPGIALYGGNPFSSGANPMAPVVHLHGRIVQVRQAAQGETVGYGANQSLERATRLATVAVGYADGYIRMLGSTASSTGAAGYIGGYWAPIIGRVSMDLITLDVTGIPEHVVQRGAMVELLGDNIELEDIARMAGTINYEVLTRLGRRHQRIYFDD